MGQHTYVYDLYVVFTRLGSESCLDIFPTFFSCLVCVCKIILIYFIERVLKLIFISSLDTSSHPVILISVYYLASMKALNQELEFN